MERFDFIVVGGGSAGCVVANRLVTRRRAKVLLLEAGPEKTSILARIPAGTGKMWAGKTNYVRRWFSEEEPGLGGRTVPLEHGSVIGGGSTVNMMAYLRGGREDYERWGTGWRWEDLLPYFRSQERNERFDDDVHGSEGSLAVSSPNYYTDLSYRFVRAMQRMGLAYRADLADGEVRGVGYTQSTMSNGERWSAAEAFLNPVRNDPLLRVVTGAEVSRVIIENGQARGVEYFCGGRFFRAEAEGEIVLTAGTYATPKLLMLSGIGPAAELADFGISVQRDLMGVGRNLQDHHYAVLSASAPKNSGFFGQDRGLRLIVNGLRYLLFKDGPAATTGCESLAYISSEGQGAEINLQLYCMAMMHPKVPRNKQGPGVSLLINLLNPAARGSVRLRSANAADPPKIELGWLTDAYDIKAMIDGFRYAREALAQQPFEEIGCSEIWPGRNVESDDEVLDHIRTSLVSNHHPVGTCRMGDSREPDAVLDRSLRVIGVDKLRVMDASMMPWLIRGGTNSTVMAVADRGVDLMIGH